MPLAKRLLNATLLVVKIERRRALRAIRRWPAPQNGDDTQMNLPEVGIASSTWPMHMDSMMPALTHARSFSHHPIVPQPTRGRPSFIPSL